LTSTNNSKNSIFQPSLLLSTQQTDHSHQNFGYSSPRFTPYNSQLSIKNRIKNNQLENDLVSHQKNASLQHQLYTTSLPLSNFAPQVNTPWNAFSSDFFINNPQTYAMAAVAASLHTNISQSHNIFQHNSKAQQDFLLPISSLCSSIRTQLASVNQKQTHENSLPCSNMNNNNLSYLNSSVNCSSVSSGYSSTNDELGASSSKNNSSIDIKSKDENQSQIADETSDDQNNDDGGDESANELVTIKNDNRKEETSENKDQPNKHLGHILNWIKNSSPSSIENLSELSSRLFYSATRWAKNQRNLINLPETDQNLIVAENLNELFLLHIAETKSTINEST
jgi:hypothetical protein